MVNGIAVAVAGAIALQMLFTAVAGDYTKSTGAGPDPRADMFASTDHTLTGAATRQVVDRFRPPRGSARRSASRAPT